VSAGKKTKPQISQMPRFLNVFWLGLTKAQLFGEHGSTGFQPVFVRSTNGFFEAI
jgi:hypothetical protein